ncbi:hypothetical protein VPH35_000768 [Triticum aestivum]
MALPHCGVGSTAREASPGRRVALQVHGGRDWNRRLCPRWGAGPCPPRKSRAKSTDALVPAVAAPDTGRKNVEAEGLGCSRRTGLRSQLPSWSAVEVRSAVRRLPALERWASFGTPGRRASSR